LLCNDDGKVMILVWELIILLIDELISSNTIFIVQFACLFSV